LHGAINKQIPIKIAYCHKTHFERKNVFCFDNLHSDAILVLDIFPQVSQLIQREHGQNTANDSQTIEVVLVGVRVILQIGGNGLETVQDAAVQSLNWGWALGVSTMQIRLNGTIIQNKKRNRLNTFQNLKFKTKSTYTPS
jgi:hypothetical protein